MNNMGAVDVIVFGSAIVDFICYSSRLPKIGETLHGDRFQTGFGGKGANQCVAAARLGAKTALIANLGDDHWGRNYLKNLKEENVNTEFVQLVEGESTGIAQIGVSSNGDNQIVIVTGANKKLSAETFRKALDKFTNSKVLVCQLETPLDETIKALKVFNGISILNAAPALANTPIDLIKNATILCVNEIEASLMTDTHVKTIHDAKTAIERLVQLGANTIIITLGELGAVFSEVCDRKVIHIGVRKVDKVVDTTGAGDAFIGALAHFLSICPEKSLAQKIGAACEIAATSVRFLGTQSSYTRANEIEDKDYVNKEYESKVL